MTKLPMQFYIALDHKEAVKVLINQGEDPLRTFPTTEAIYTFFNGDLSWMSEEVSDKIKKTRRSQGAFGRF